MVGRAPLNKQDKKKLVAAIKKDLKTDCRFLMNKQDKDSCLKGRHPCPRWKFDYCSTFEKYAFDGV